MSANTDRHGTLHTQRKLTQDAAEVFLALQPKIVNMYDACPYMEINKKSITLTQLTRCCRGLQS